MPPRHVSHLNPWPLNLLHVPVLIWRPSLHVACGHTTQIGQIKPPLLTRYCPAGQVTVLQAHLNPLPSLPHVPERVWPVPHCAFVHGAHWLVLDRTYCSAVHVGGQSKQ